MASFAIARIAASTMACMVASMELIALSAMVHALCCVEPQLFPLLLVFSFSAFCFFDVRSDSAVFVGREMKRRIRVVLVVANLVLSLALFSTPLQPRAHGRIRHVLQALAVPVDRRGHALLRRADAVHGRQQKRVLPAGPGRALCALCRGRVHLDT